MSARHFFVFDVESVGLSGEGFAWGGVVIDRTGAILLEFCSFTGHEKALGKEADRQWVRENVPALNNEGWRRTTVEVRDDFWMVWNRLLEQFPDIVLAADCPFPVETNFLTAGINDVPERKCLQPYPLIDVASVVLAAGGDPIGSFARLPNELPAHDPLRDARQSARILCESLSVIGAWKEQAGR